MNNTQRIASGILSIGMGLLLPFPAVAQVLRL